MEPASTSIERIVYIAALATKVEDIDPILDGLRRITSRLDIKQDVPLPAADLATLQTVQKQLETYLLTKEKLRFFTPESLSLQIEQHMKKATGLVSKRQLAGVIVMSIIAAIGAAFLPMLHGIPQRGRVGGSVLFSALTIGAAWLFLRALSSFKSELRRAFVVICAGIALLGLSLLEQPIIHLLGIQDQPVVGILYPLPILVASVLFHAGNLRYVHLVGVRSRWSTMTPALIAASILTAISWFLPHPAIHESELIHDIATTIWCFVMAMPLGSALVLPMAVRKLPELYKPSMRALGASMIPTVAVTSYLYFLNLISNPYADSPQVTVLFLLVIVMGIMLLRAGYAFNKVSKY